MAFPPSTPLDIVEEDYIGFYNRAGDAPGANFWINQLQSNSKLGVAVGFAVSSESLAIYPYLSAPNVIAPQTYIDQIYSNVFGRVADTAGETFWTNRLAQLNSFFSNADGSLNTANLLSFAPGTDLGRYGSTLTQSGKFVAAVEVLTEMLQSVNSQTGTADANLMANRITVAEDYTQRTGNANVPFSQASSKGVIAATTADSASVTTAEAITTAYIAGGGTPPQSLVFTTGVDSLVGTNGNDLFTGDNTGSTATVTAGDAANGGQGIDSFNYFVNTGTTAVVSPQLNSIENVNLVGGGVAHTGDFSQAVGLQALTIKQSAGGDSYTVGSGVAVGLDNYTAAVNETFVLPSTQTSVTLNLANAVKTAGNVILTDAGLTSVALVSSGNGTNQIGNITVSNTVNTLTIAGAANTTITGQLNANIVNIDGSASTGSEKFKAGFTVVASTIKTGSGNDVVDITQVFQTKTTDNFGAGNDTVIAGSASFFANSLIDGDAGTDIINFTTGAALTADKTFIKNFETLDVSGTATNQTYDVTLLSGITKVEVDAGVNGTGGGATGITGNVTFSNAPTTFALDVVSAKSVDLGIANSIIETLKTDAVSPATDALTVNLTSVDGNNNLTAEGNITVKVLDVSQIENLTIGANITTADTNVKASTYLETVTTLTDASLQKLVITGNESVKIGDMSSATLVSSIDASGSTGNIQLDYSASTKAVNYLGSAGIDSITTSNGGTVYGAAGNDQIKLVSAGTASDTIVYKSGTEANLTDVDGNGKADGTVETITNFVTTAASAVSHDTIDLTNIGGFTGSQHAAGTVALSAAPNDNATFATTQANFFVDGGGQRGAMIGVTGGDTYVFVDANHDGNFNIATDLVIKIAGVANFANTDINFG